MTSPEARYVDGRAILTRLGRAVHVAGAKLAPRSIANSTARATGCTT